MDLFRHPFSLEIERIYNLFSDIKNICNSEGTSIDLDATGIIENLVFGAKTNINVNFSKIKKNIIDIKKSNNVVVCFSGGKDSVATAIKLRKDGYNVFLYHLKGINKSYPDEFERAKNIAKYLDMPLYIENIKIGNVHGFKESPIKNQLICSYALEYAINNNIGVNIAFGDFKEDNINNSLFDRNWSDAVEMWEAYQSYIRTYIPNFNIVIPFNNYNETLDIVSNDIKLLNMIQGCILPYRYKKMIKNKNETKYGIKLLDNRCGSCWKCCVEYIALANKGTLPYNNGFYRHCIDFLKSKMNEEKPFIKGRDDKIVYESFLGEKFENSKYYITNKQS